MPVFYRPFLQMRFALACGLLASIAARLVAQSGQAAPAPVFKTGARTVVVDVVVNNQKGDPVPALRKEHFLVLEDGKPQAIDFFEEHAPKTLPAGAPQPLPKMPPNVFSNVPPAPEDDAVNVLLLDSLNTPEQDFAYAHNEVLSYLKNVKPGTRLAIFTLGDKLNFVQGFTADTALLATAFQNKQKGANGGFSQSLVSRSDNAEITATIGGINASATGSGLAASQAVQAVMDAFRNYKSFAMRNRTLMTLEALDHMARFLADVPGRKNLIWFSSTFPVVIFPKFDQRQKAEDRVVPLSRIHQTADLLTAARVAVYPVNARGVMTESVINADSAGAGNDPLGPTHLGTSDPTTTYAAESAERASTIVDMNQLAHDTGGKAIYNTNDLSSATQRAVADGTQYYTLAYTPTNKSVDGQYRRIEIKLKEGHYRLAYRQGYNATDTSALSQTTPGEPLRASLGFGLPSATQILYAARVVPAIPQPAPNAKHAGKNAKLSGPFTRYSVDFFIRWTDVALVPAPDGTHNGKLQIDLLAYDQDGKAVNWEGNTQQMQLTPDLYAAIQRSGLPAHMEIDLPNTPVYLETGVYDWTTGNTGTLQIPISPADTKPSSATH